MVDVVLWHEDRAGCVVSLAVVLLEPRQLEAGPRGGGRIAAFGQIRGRSVLTLEVGANAGGPLVVPQRGCIARRPSRFVDQHRPVHLSAGADRSNTLGCAFDRGKRVPDRSRDAGPPVERPLLGPAELRYDLIMLARRNMDNHARPIDEGSADAARADVNGKGQVARHSLSA